MVTVERLTFNYSGTSMSPMFRSGDWLWVQPYESRKISVGDVIVFRPTGESRITTHRVVAVNNNGVKTRGDNSRMEDPYSLQLHEIIGYVATIRRGTRSIRIRHGRLGLFFARFRRVIRQINLVVSGFFHPLYRYVADSRVLSRMFSRWLCPQIVCFTKPDGIESQLFIGGHFVGRRPPGSEKWQIRRPFRLFIDPSLLQE